MFTSLPLVTLMGALAAPSLVQAVPAGPGFPYWAGHRAPWSPSYKKALYFLENDSEGAKLGAVEICEDGTLSNTAETPTGGKGMLNINSTSHEPLGPDSLNSQSTVITGDDYVFTVNAGSNTVVMFRVDPWDPLHPKMVGSPQDTLGKVPMSVAYSSPLQMACVLNTGDRGGVTCFHVSPIYGLTPLDKNARDTSFALNNPVPVMGPNNDASQLSFSPSSSYLLASIKGDPKTKKESFMYAWPVDQRRRTVARDAVISRFDGIYAIYGFSFTGDDRHVFFSTTDFGGALAYVDPATLRLNILAQDPAPKLKASCWSLWSPALKKAYALDAASPTLGVYDAGSGHFLSYLPTEMEFKGVFDSVLQKDTDVMYFASASSRIGGLNLATGKVVADLDLAGKVGDRKLWQGLALYPSGDAVPQWG